MKISMWNLADWLRAYDIQCFISGGSATIRTVRWLTGSLFHKDVVYVFRESGDGSGDEGNGYAYIVNRYDIIKIKSADTDIIFNEIITALDYFNQWEESLNDFVSDENGLQKMLDQSVALLKSPAFLYNTSGEVLAISSSYPPSLHWHWAELCRDRRISDQRLTTFKESGGFTHVFTDKAPTFHCSAFESYHYWHCSLYLLEHRVAQFVAFDFNGTFPRGIASVIQTLIFYMQKHMDAFCRIYLPLSRFTAQLTALLDDQPVIREELLPMLTSMGWQWNDTYCVAVIAERSEEEAVLISRTYSYLADHLDHGYSLLYHQQIILILNLSRAHLSAARYFESLKHFLNENLFCGVSYCFYDFGQFATYYRQAMTALDFHQGSYETFCYAEDVAWPVLLDHFHKNSALRYYVHPALFLLKELDEKSNSQYFDTLAAFVFCGCHLSESARSLRIHRNTMLYRLNKISELISMDLLSLAPDRKEYEILWMSFFLFRECQ